MADERSGRSAKASAKPTLLAGGNPQIAKGDGDAPVQAYIEAMPGWKRDVGRRLDALISANVPPVESKNEGTRYFHVHEGDQLDEELVASWIRQASQLPGWAGFGR